MTVEISETKLQNTNKKFILSNNLPTTEYFSSKFSIITSGIPQGGIVGPSLSAT